MEKNVNPASECREIGDIEILHKFFYDILVSLPDFCDNIYSRAFYNSCLAGGGALWHMPEEHPHLIY